MNARNARRSRLVSIALVLSLAALALVFRRRQLIAWFSGGSMAGSPTVGAWARRRGTGRSVRPRPWRAPHRRCSAGRGRSLRRARCTRPSRKRRPASAPTCGMDLILVTKEQQQEGVVTIDDARRQLIGAPSPSPRADAKGLPRRRSRHLRRVVTADVNLKVHGWITKLYVSQTGPEGLGCAIVRLFAVQSGALQRGAGLHPGDAGSGDSVALARRWPGPGRDARAGGTPAAALAWPGGRADRRADQTRRAVGERSDRGAHERLHH